MANPEQTSSSFADSDREAKYNAANYCAEHDLECLPFEEAIKIHGQLSAEGLVDEEEGNEETKAGSTGRPRHPASASHSQERVHWNWTKGVVAIAGSLMLISFFLPLLGSRDPETYGQSLSTMQVATANAPELWIIPCTFFVILHALTRRRSLESLHAGRLGLWIGSWATVASWAVFFYRLDPDWARRGFVLEAGFWTCALSLGVLLFMIPKLGSKRPSKVLRYSPSA